MLGRKSRLIACRAGIAHRLVRRILVGGAHPTCLALLIVALNVACLVGAPGSVATAPMPYQAAQSAQAPPVSAALPEPIYWKQHLFLIPYQWGSAAEPGAAR